MPQAVAQWRMAVTMFLPTPKRAIASSSRKMLRVAGAAFVPFDGIIGLF